MQFDLLASNLDRPNHFYKKKSFKSAGAVNRQSDRPMDQKTDGTIYGQMDGWNDGRTDGQMEGAS